MSTNSSKTVARKHNTRRCPAGNQVRSCLVSLGRICVTSFDGLGEREIDCIPDKNDCANLWVCKTPSPRSGRSPGKGLKTRVDFVKCPALDTESLIAASKEIS